jgi:formylglycine-generating enzyme required for sulfatase activity
MARRVLGKTPAALITVLLVLALVAGCGGETVADTPVPPSAEPGRTLAPNTAAPSLVSPTSPPTELPAPTDTPAPTAMPDVPAEEVTFDTDDGATIAGTLFGDGDLAVLFLHQGFGTATQATWHPFARLVAEQGYAALTITFRGRGRSEGVKGEDYMMHDARGAIALLRARGYERLVCVGAGIWGGEPCLRLALAGELEGVGIIAAPMETGTSGEFTDEALSSLTIPKLFVFGEKDTQGVAECMERMYELSAEPKILISYDSAARGTELLRSPYGDDMRGQMLDFLQHVWLSGLPSEPPANPSLGDTWVRPKDGMVMVYVPGGTFEMGLSQEELDEWLAECSASTQYCTPAFYQDEMPQHTVTVDGFWMDLTEVSNAQYAAFLNDHGNRGENGVKLLELDEGYVRIERFGDGYRARPAAKDHAVVMMSWYGADAYCRWVGGRLPTEAEWEYAAKGPEGNRYPWGDAEPTCELANWGACHASSIDAADLPAGASWCGVLGMAGNAWDWVSDRFGPYSALPQVNPTGPDTGGIRVARGGGWHANQWMTRTTFRLHDTGPTSHVGCFGVRCVYAPEASSP